MPVIETNELISKNYPPEVMEAALILLQRFGVPEADRLRWALTQKQLMAQLLTYYRESNQPVPH